MLRTAQRDLTPVRRYGAPMNAVGVMSYAGGRLRRYA